MGYQTTGCFWPMACLKHAGLFFSLAQSWTISAQATKRVVSKWASSLSVWPIKQIICPAHLLSGPPILPSWVIKHIIRPCPLSKWAGPINMLTGQPKYLSRPSS
jgi:hypothetical protein